jgi:thiamine-monophosphate kinase
VGNSEQQWIEKIAKGQRIGKHRDLLLGIGDDAALWKPRRGYEAILTCDWFLEGSHFLRDKYPPDSVGWKCLARAISDIAAMGGAPSCFLLSLALPESATRGKARNSSWLDQFLRGLRRASRRFGCVLAGGDLTRTREILINITVIGQVTAGRAVLRSGAVPGDSIFVSGRLGEADLGLRLLREGRSGRSQADRFLRKHLYPEPRLALGEFLARRKLATSMMDISDGLSSDLPRLCAASQVGARIEAAKLPVPILPEGKSARRLDLVDLALNGGDDYELLFTVKRRNLARIPRSFGGVALTEIGEITSGKAIQFVQRDGTKPLVARGWDPFRK